MSVLQAIQKTKDRVIYLLKKATRYRDNDEKLVCAFWWSELKKMNLSEAELEQCKKFLELYAEGKLISADVITRARRKAQEENPDLRGNNWSKRQVEEKEVRQHIND